MKKTLIFIFTLLLTFSLASCKKKPVDKETITDEETSEVEDLTTEEVDLSDDEFNLYLKDHNTLSVSDLDTLLLGMIPSNLPPIFGNFQLANTLVTITDKTKVNEEPKISKYAAFKEGTILYALEEKTASNSLYKLDISRIGELFTDPELDANNQKESKGQESEFLPHDLIDIVLARLSTSLGLEKSITTELLLSQIVFKIEDFQKLPNNVYQYKNEAIAKRLSEVFKTLNIDLSEKMILVFLNGFDTFNIFVTFKDKFIREVSLKMQIGKDDFRDPQNLDKLVISFKVAYKYALEEVVETSYELDYLNHQKKAGIENKNHVKVMISEEANKFSGRIYLNTLDSTKPQEALELNLTFNYDYLQTILNLKAVINKHLQALGVLTFKDDYLVQGEVSVKPVLIGNLGVEVYHISFMSSDDVVIPPVDRDSAIDLIPIIKAELAKINQQDKA